MPPRRSGRTSGRSPRTSVRPPYLPASSPQGRAIYRGRSSGPAPHHHDRRTHRVARAKVPSFASGLSVARARVRDAPWDMAHWTELADLLYRKGDFDLAAKAYKRVQELVSDEPTDGTPEGHAPPAHPRHPRAPPAPQEKADAPAPARTLSPTHPPLAEKPSGPEPQPSAMVVAVPKVPVITSASGQTRAIRLPGTNIMVAVTGLSPSPSTLPTPRRLRAQEPEVERGSSPSPAAGPRSSPSPPPPVAASKAPARPVEDDKMRSVLQQDMVRFLQIFDRPVAPQVEKKRPSPPDEDPPEADSSTEGT